MACEGLFRERLRDSGLRLTPQREMILTVLHQLECPATAEEIYAGVQALSSAVDISTVYRTLDLLKELALVACIDRGSEGHWYELLGLHGPHLHLVCQSCGAIVGVDLVDAEPLIAHLQATHKFRAKLDEVTIPGLCRDCQTAAGVSDVD